MASGPRSTEPTRPVGLVWDGRWGSWSDKGIYVLAACVIDIEVIAESELRPIVDAVDDVGRLLVDDVPKGSHCVNVKLVPGSSKRRMLRVAMVCERDTCLMLRQKWQKRRLCGGAFIASFISFSDTSQTTYAAMVASRMPPYNKAETGLALELPLRWISQSLLEEQDTVRLGPGSHWFDFSSLFGQVIFADLVNTGDADFVSLLVRFAQTEGARAMYEALTSRYLYNPVNTSCNDTHPASCTIGTHTSLLQRLQVRPESEVCFILRRCGGAEKKAGPATIHVTNSKPRVVIGREESCDVMLRRAHVSKEHAVIAMRPNDAGTGKILTIQDTSANGTWVNRRRLNPQAISDLQLGDRISFLPEHHDYYRDALLYEVASAVEESLAVETRGAVVSHSIGKRGVPTVDITDDASPRRLRRRTSAANGSPAHSRSPNVHAAQPVAVDVTDKTIVSEDGVVAVEDVESPRSPSAEPPTVPWTVSEDLGAWVRGLDGGSLAQYEATLLTLFDNVSQVRSLYADRLNNFFADVGVEDDLHKLAFTTALKQLRQ